MRTDGVHCREFAGAGPAVKVASSSGVFCLFRYLWANFGVSPFSHTHYYRYWDNSRLVRYRKYQSEA